MHGDLPRTPALLCACLLLAACAEIPPVEVEPSEVLAPLLLTFPPPPGSPAADAHAWYADCGNGLVFSMADLLPPIAHGMVRQRIPYGWTSPDEWRDCSGNFLRLSSYVGSACPAGSEDLAAPPGIADYVPRGDNVTDLEPRARNSREIARWYHDQGRFVPVFYDRANRRGRSASLEDARYLLKPGAVLWFSRNRPLEAGGVDQLFARNARDTQIRHLGTVVDVTYDDDGQVVGYAMYHGRNPLRAGSITDGHSIDGTAGGPPFGNGDEVLVGIGTLLPIALPPER